MAMNEPIAANGSLALIDSVSIQQVAATMQKISQFQKVIQQTLHANHDYGIVPGSSKPTLLKPGAEKILMMMGLRSEFEIVDSTRDFENGFFQYQVRCKLYKGDTLITEGLGACNTRERRYKNQDPYTLDNTVLKMAKKRALVDAVLLVASLSDIFTQDLEDDIEGTPVEEKASHNQIKYIHKLIADKKISEEDYKKVLKQYYNVESSTELSKEQASELIERLQKAQNKAGVNNEKRD